MLDVFIGDCMHKKVAITISSVLSKCCRFLPAVYRMPMFFYLESVFVCRPSAFCAAVVLACSRVCVCFWRPEWKPSSRKPCVSERRRVQDSGLEL